MISIKHYNYFISYLKKICLDILGRLSLLIYPYKLSYYTSMFIDYVASVRFKLLTKNTGVAFIERPFYIKGHKYIKYNSFYSHAGLRLECWEEYEGVRYNPSIIIGKNVCFNFRCHIGAIDHIVIGDNVLIGSNVLITDHSHGYNSIVDIRTSPSKRNLYSKGPVVIEDNVWIGENVSILPNVVIGHNSIVGANSVVTKNIPPFSLVGGNPAKIIKTIN